MRTTIKRNWKMLLPAALLLVGLLTWALWTGLTVRTYTVQSSKVNAPVRLLLLSDLHSTLHGREQEKLLALIRTQDPDAILMAGDMADDEVPHDGIRLLLEGVAGERPCYYVTGNHEFWAEDTGEILDMFRDHGVTVLRGEGAALTVRGQELQIFGVDDPEGFQSETGWRAQLAACREGLDSGAFSVLLSHRPERVEDYRGGGFDLVVCGHAHGGQVRIPGILNGLLAPDQGLFPDYAGGLYDLEGTHMAVSRGLSINPRLPRVFDPPEVVVLEIVP